MKQVLDFAKANIKRLVILLIALFLVVYFVAGLIKYRIPKNTNKLPELPYEEGVLIDKDEDFTNKNKYEVVAKSANTNNTSMYIDLETTNIIVDNGTNEYMTLPFDQGKANYSAAERSPINISYYYKGKTTPTNINGYNGSIKDGYYEVYQLVDGVRVVYEIGQRDIKTSWIPMSIYRSEYNEIYANTTPEKKLALQASYDTTVTSEIISLYSTVGQEHLALLYDLWWNDLGMTLEELADRAIGLSGKPSMVEMPLFKIPVDYRLTEDGDFIVEVLYDKIEENGPDLGEKTLKLKNIVLLENFVYMNINESEEDDFMFIPDGSGAIIKPYYLDQITNYSAPFYNNTSLLNDDKNPNEELLIPAFGYVKNKKGILAVVESGAGIGKFSSNVTSGNLKAYTDFNVRVDNTYEFIEGVKINTQEEMIKDQRVKLRYMFLTEEDEKLSYFDMVKVLQDRYFDNDLKDHYVPVNIEMIGAIEELRHFVGIPYFKTVGLTNYKQALELRDIFGDDLIYKYAGFSKGGVKGVNQSKIKRDSALGSNKDFKNLIETFEDLYYDIYLFEKYNAKDKNFKNSKHGLKVVGGEVQTYYETSRMTHLQERNDLSKYYLLDINYLDGTVSKFMKSNQKFNNLALRDLGNRFYANYTLNVVNPKEAEYIVIENIKSLKENRTLMLDNPFFHYALYASVIEGLPTVSSKNIMFYSDVPFLQLLYAPYMQVFGNHVNLDNEFNKDLTFALMSLTGLKYTLTYEKTETTKENPLYNKYYATYYVDHREDILNNKDVLNNFVNENNEITSHILIAPNVYEVTYGSNTYVFNLSNHTYNYKGTAVNSNDYIKVI